MNKSLLFIMLSLIFMNTIFASTKVKLNLSQDENLYLKNKKVIKMCVDPNWMPFEKIEKGKHIGIAADYINILSEGIEIPIKLVLTTSWRESLSKAKNRDCDILSLASQTETRKEYMNFTSSYITAPIVIATRSNIPFINNLSEVLDKKLAVVKGYSLSERLKKLYPNINLVEVNSIQEGLKMVSYNKIFGYLDNSIVINYEIQQNFIGIIKISGKFQENFKLNIATRNDEPLLNKIFQKAINNINLEQKQNIFNKWILVKQISETDYNLIIQIILIFTVILIIIFYFLIRQNKLKKEIEDLNYNLEAKINTAMYDLLEAKKLAKMGIWSFDIQKQKLIWCDETYKIFDMHRRKDRELKLKDYLSLIHLDDSFFISRMYNNHLELKNEFHETHKIVTHSNKTKWVEVRCITTFDKDGRPCISKGTIQDITEKKLQDIKIQQKDKQMLHQSRLAQMGEMMSMIAHQWRQPLNAISLTSSNLQLKCIMDEMDKDFFNKELQFIDEYSQHLSTTIDDFRSFFKENKEKEVTTLIHIVNDILNIVRISIENKNIKIITDLKCHLNFKTYSNELKQVVLNLIKNAEDALLENKIDNPVITIQTICNADCQNQILIIKDNAGGINEDIIEKVFDPYFSTKKDKDGTGLGLYMSKTIIEEHCGGKLTVSNDRDGAVFSVVLPSYLDK